MRNFVWHGDNITIPAPAAVASGEFVVVGLLRGVAQANAAEGDLVALKTEGVFTLPVTAAGAVVIGDPIYVTALGALTDADEGNTYIGYAVKDATPLAGTAAVEVRLVN